MKIAAVSAEYVRAPLGSEFRPTWNAGVVQDAIATVLVRVETDAGLVGIGPLANAHLAAAVTNCAWLEIPYDPPAFTHEGRDRLLAGSRHVRPGGMVKLPDRPGIGLDEDFLASYRVAHR